MNDENKNNSLQFNILGLPSNEEIEVEDEETEKTPYRREPKLPKEIQDAFDKMFGSFGGSEDSPQSKQSLGEMANDLTNQMSQISPQQRAMLDHFMKSMGINIDELMDDIKSMVDENALDDTEDDDSDEKTETKFVFELGKIEHLFQAEAFQQILIETDPNFYINFTGDFGPGPYTTTFFSSKNWPCYSSCPVPLTRIAQFSIVDHNNKYILLYGTPNDPSEQGIFMAVIKGESGGYELVIPEYGNTYDLVNPEGEWANEEMFEDNPKNCRLFSSKTQPELFTEEGKFIFLDLEKIHAGLTWLLCQKEEPLVSPKKFGDLIQMRSSVDTTNYTHILRVGSLKANSSTAAALLKRDFDVPEEKNVFDFYLKFPEAIPGIVANYLADYLNKTNMTESLLLDNCELKVKGRGDILYINFDLGNIGTNLGLWINPKGNSEL